MLCQQSLLEINRTVVVCLPTYISMHRTRVEFTLGTSFARFPWSLDEVFLQGETYLTDTLPQCYSLTNPNLASDPLRQASQRVIMRKHQPLALICGNVTHPPHSTPEALRRNRMVLLLLAMSPTLHAVLQRLLGVAGWSYMALWPVTQVRGVVAFLRYFKLLTHF